MKRTLACLAALTLGVAVPAAHAEQTDYRADPVGDILAQAKTLQASDPQASAADAAEPSTSQPAAAESVPSPAGKRDLMMKATLYHSGKGGVGTRDSLGCAVVPLRTVATDRGVMPRRSILFIKETVGLEMPDGSRHDGYWYASDIGGGVRGAHIDLYTGNGAGSMRAAQKLNQQRLTVTRVGEFEGCPKAGARVAMN